MADKQPHNQEGSVRERIKRPQVPKKHTQAEATTKEKGAVPTELDGGSGVIARGHKFWGETHFISL